MGEHVDKTKGRIKQAIGGLTGNTKLKREGKMDGNRSRGSCGLVASSQMVG